MTFLRKLAFFLAALPLVVLTAARVNRLERELALGALIERLRARRSQPLSRLLARPEWLAGAVERVLPLLPPRRYGPCLRRSLLLLDLWSRCGLDPKLHLGFRLQGAERDGHAWLTAELPDGRAIQASGPNGTQPAFVL